MKRAIVQRKFAGVVVAALLCGPLLGIARAQDQQSAPPTSEKGIVPIPDYGGDLLNRSHLFGDLGGTRTELARKGIQFNADWVQTVQSVVDGGRDTGTKYGGSMDYDLTLDLYRMGVLPGALLKVRAESRYGESVNDMTGALLPANADAFFPLHTPLDDCVPIAVTNLTYFQFLSEQFGVFFGKFDALDSDLNEFASGRGKSQFMNLQLIFGGSLSLLPYSTVGGGVIVVPTKNITVKSVVFSLTDSSTTTGLDDCEGWVSATEAAFQYRLGTLPGGANVGGI
jgi:porin